MNNAELKPLISVVIVNYNSGDYLQKSILSVLDTTNPVEIIVSDNNSTDSSLIKMSGLVNDNNAISVIRNDTNKGFSVAANQAIIKCKGEYILLLNPDCIVGKDTIPRMIEAMERYPNAGMAGCLINNPDGSEQIGCRRLIPTPYRSLKRALNLDKIFRSHPKFQSFNILGTPLPDSPTSTEAISGAFMFVRRSAMDEVGLLDEKYFMHCEDLDWCIRFRNSGKDILFVPDATAVHYQGSCSKKNPVKVLWYKHTGMVIFYNKFLRTRYPLPLMLLVMVSVWVRFALLAIPLSLQNILTRMRNKDDVNNFIAIHHELNKSASETQLSGLENTAKELGGKRLFITGGSGFIGTRLLQSLKEAASISVLSRKQMLPAIHDFSDGITIIRGDLADHTTMPDDMLDNIDSVIHLASYVHKDKKRETDEKHYTVTEDGTRYLISKAVKAGVKKFIYVSSVKAMGENTDQLADEESSCHPESPYGLSKLAAERLVLDLGRKHGIHVCVIRLPMVYGAGNKGNLPRMIAQIDRNCFPPLPDIQNKRSMVHVDDVVQAILLSVTRKNANGNTYIVTDGEFYSTYRIYLEIYKQLKNKTPLLRMPVFVFRLLAKVGDLFGRLTGRPFVFNSDIYRKLFDSAYYSSTKIQNELGYKPIKTFYSALPELIDEYRKGQE